jgi:hypothetical protein
VIETFTQAITEGNELNGYLQSTRNESDGSSTYNQQGIENTKQKLNEKGQASHYRQQKRPSNDQIK